jgi:hypothetical protein
MLLRVLYWVGAFANLVKIKQVDTCHIGKPGRVIKLNAFEQLSAKTPTVAAAPLLSFPLAVIPPSEPLTPLSEPLNAPLIPLSEPVIPLSHPLTRLIWLRLPLPLIFVHQELPVL